MNDKTREALELARKEIRALTALTGEGVMTASVIAAIDEALSAPAASAGLTDEQLDSVWELEFPGSKRNSTGHFPSDSGILRAYWKHGWRRAESAHGLGQWADDA